MILIFPNAKTSVYDPAYDKLDSTDAFMSFYHIPTKYIGSWNCVESAMVD